MGRFWRGNGKTSHFTLFMVEPHTGKVARVDVSPSSRSPREEEALERESGRDSQAGKGESNDAVRRSAGVWLAGFSRMLPGEVRRL